MRGPTPRGRALMLRSLSAMLRAGIPIHRVLELLALQSEEAPVRKICGDLAVHVSRGQSLSWALRQEKAFSTFQVNLVEAGEMAGNLDGVLTSLADYEEASHRDGMKVVAALVYPTFVLGLCLVLLCVGPTYLLSGQFQLLSSMGVQLPMAVRVLRGVSTAVCSWPFLIGLLLAGFGLYRIFDQPRYRERAKAWLVSLPGFKRVFTCLAVSRFARAMSVQLRAGLPAVKALATAGGATGHPGFSAQAAIEALQEGSSLRDSLAATGLFPRAFLEFVRIGEGIGGLETTMEWLGDMYHEEFEGAVTAALNALQPLAMLVTGIVAAAVMLATMLPMVKALQQL